MKEIVFYCVIYVPTVYQKSERENPDLFCPEYCCDLVWAIPTWFKVIDQIVMYISLFGKGYTPFCFLQASVSYNFP